MDIFQQWSDFGNGTWFTLKSVAKMTHIWEKCILNICAAECTFLTYTVRVIFYYNLCPPFFLGKDKMPEMHWCWW